MGIERLKKGEKVYFAEIKFEERPDKLIYELKKYFLAEASVDKAYVAIVMYEDEMMPHPVIGIELVDHSKQKYLELIPTIRSIISDFIKLGDSVDTIMVAPGEVGEYFIEKCQPFYSRN